MSEELDVTMEEGTTEDIPNEETAEAIDPATDEPAAVEEAEGESERVVTFTGDDGVAVHSLRVP